MRGMIMLPQIDPKEWQLLVNSLQNFVITLEKLDQIFNTHIFHPTQWQTWTLLFSLLSLRATLLVSELLVAAKVHDFVLFTQSSLFVGFRCYLIGMFFYAHALCLRFRALLFCEFQIGRLSILLSWIRLWINGEVYPSSFNSSTETQEYEFHGNRCPSVLYQ